MIFLKRKRLIIWLIRAYLKRWGKTISLCFLLGLLLFLLLYINRNFIASRIPVTESRTIGIVGDYSVDDFPNNMPEEILSKTSRGLTKISSTGQILPDVAKSWEVKDDGKTFVFYLHDNLYFSDGKPLDSESINYNFAEVTVERPAKSAIVFKLKDKYSPFLVTVANRKIFNDDLVGVSDYKITEIEDKNGFINQIELESKKDKSKIRYYFYPTQAALKDAYVLGDVSEIIDINNLDYANTDFSKFKNTNLDKVANYNKLATIFLNNRDPLLSDKKIRKALAFSLPNEFEEGIRNYTPYSPKFWANNSSIIIERDLEYAKLQLEESESSSSGKIKIELSTLRPYRKVAEKVAKNWKEIGVEANVKVVEGIPTTYQAFLGELPLIKDPDQYAFWHTGQSANITNYRNLRIDKLLEDGRTITDTEERKNIYLDFQKYLIDDMPAIFLYFPYTYTLTRK